MSDRTDDIRETLQKHVDDFKTEIGYGHPLIVSSPFYPYDHPNAICPNSDDPGCYIFGVGKEVRYVGKAYRALGNRIWAHIGRQRMAGEECVFPTCVPWFKECGPDIGVWSVAVPKNHWWLASALESFMREKVWPHKNKRM